MSQENTKKAGLIVLLIAVSVGSVFGILGGILGATLGGYPGFIALIIGSVLILIGAVYGINKILTGMRAPRAQQKMKSKSNTLVWIIVAIVSGIGVFLTYFLGMRMFRGPPVFMIIIIVILICLCLFSLFTLISGRSIRRENIEDTMPSIDVEEINIE